MSRDETLDSLRQECWTRAINAYGTGYLFENRARELRPYVRGLTFLGIAVPAAAGGILLAVGPTGTAIPYLLAIAAPLGVVQLIGSVWSLASRWDDSLVYFQESATDNYRLSEQYRKLGADPPSDARLRFEIIEASYQARCDADTKQALNEKEKRRGLRAGLKQFQRKCVACNVVPNSMRPTKCGVCGDF
jgi:mobilome CxxCx(11)CxxC protein